MGNSGSVAQASLRVAVAQLNFVVGDLHGNAQRIIDAAHEAHARGAQVLVTPELALSGYAAEDLYLRPGFLRSCREQLDRIAGALAPLQDLVVVVGHPQSIEAASLPNSRSRFSPACLNMATALSGGKVLASYAKWNLPNYQVFDERRYFQPGQQTCVFTWKGYRLGLLICEDAWYPEPAAAARDEGAEILLVLNASPFHVGKRQEREGQMALRVAETGLPLLYAHMVGGQDEVVFEGNSFAVASSGVVQARAVAFQEDLPVWSYSSSTGQWSGEISPAQQPMQELWHALVLGVRDYIEKNGFPSVCLGLSGGIDSAVVMAIAVDALGADRVRAIMMPSPYTAEMSWIDACEMARRMGVRYDEWSIVPVFESLQTVLAQEFSGLPADTTEENLQARIRGTLLMALSNKTGALVLTTGNKSEMATGYCTLYGDMAGGFAVIKDVVKTRVFELARWRNQNDPYQTGSNPIPDRIITRPPSAELRPDQTDQDSLPPYEVLDAILALYMEEDVSPSDIVDQGFDEAHVKQVVRLVRLNEYKRRQAAIGIRVTHRSFGRDWRYPITNRYLSW